MKNLAIKGHTNLGKKVIEILKMLGGQNYSQNLLGGTEYNYYYIGNYSTISCIPKEKMDSSFVKFTLEEFFEKFPYNVGDKVQHKGATSCGTVYEIEQIKWEDDQIKYIICDLYWKNCKCTVTSENLQPYKEENYGRT